MKNIWIPLLIIFGLASILLVSGCISIPGEKMNENNETATLSQETLDKVLSILQDNYYIQTQGMGNPDNVKIKDYTKVGALFRIDSEVNGKDYIPVYVDEKGEYVYVVTNVIKLDDLKAQIEAYKAQVKQMEKKNKPDVKLFVMSFCPYGNIAENNFYSILPIMDKINFEPVYIISKYNDSNETIAYLNSVNNRVTKQYTGKEQNCTFTDNEVNCFFTHCLRDNGILYCSMHSTGELRQDVREYIIYELYGPSKWLNYVEKVNKECNANNVDECWKGIAEDMGINTTEVEEKFNADFERVINHNMELTSEYGVSSSPTLIVNGKIYSGDRSPSSFLDFVCQGFTTEPAECNANPNEVNENATQSTQGSC